MLNSAFRRLGYYEVGNSTFFNKSDAILYASRTGEDLHWNFNEDIFSAIDWSVPIENSLSELYRQRAQQLRDKYDFVSLFYSGGVDSTNVLHSFIDNNILLDEIVIYRPRVIENRINSIDRTPYNIFSETSLAAIPHLNRYLHDPRTKVRIIHNDEAVIKLATDSKLMSQYSSLNRHAPNSFSKIAMSVTDPVWNELYLQGKSVGHIQGADKPMVIAGNPYHFYFYDASAAFVIEPTYQTDISEMISRHQFHELFYWTPDLPQLVIKQCQIVKKLCQSDPFFYALFQKAEIMTQDNFSAMLPYIYPPQVLEVRNMFSTSSPGQGLYSPQNLWFYENMPASVTGVLNDIVKDFQFAADDRFFRKKEPIGTTFKEHPLYSRGPKTTLKSTRSKKYIL